MGNTPLSPELARQAVDAVNAAIRAGFVLGGSPSAITEAARILGVHEKTLYSRVRVGTKRDGLELDKNPPPPEIEFTAPAKPRVIVRAASEAAPEGEATRLLLIGDTHVAPGQNLDRFKWFARHAGETRPDKIIQIGDLGEFASVSTHEKPGSLPQKLRPSFLNDVEAVETALAMFKDAAPSDIPLTVVLGNHEERIRTFETGNAELEGALWPQFTDVLARYNWRWVDYKRYLFLAGVGLTHVCMSLADRPYNGKTLNPLGNELIFSLIFGHTHRFAFLNVPKIGPQRSIQILNVGSAMPHGYYPSYNPSEQGAYTYGVVEATVQAGRIVQHHFIPMLELERKYA